MFISINRNADIFDKQVADELNISFAAISKKIEDYKTEDLEHKENLRYLGGNSFVAGKIVCIRETVRINGRAKNFTEVGRLNVTIPYNVWTTAVTENGESLICYIRDSSIYVQGTLSKYPQEVYVVEDIVLPK